MKTTAGWWTVGVLVVCLGCKARETQPNGTYMHGARSGPGAAIEFVIAFTFHPDGTASTCWIGGNQHGWTRLTPLTWRADGDRFLVNGAKGEDWTFVFDEKSSSQEHADLLLTEHDSKQTFQTYRHDPTLVERDGKLVDDFTNPPN